MKMLVNCKRTAAESTLPSLRAETAGEQVGDLNLHAQCIQ